ncbi:MAG: hypothetical protein TH68_04295, partial [Candidatus Synechococcus spongiarum 142]
MVAANHLRSTAAALLLGLSLVSGLGASVSSAQAQTARELISNIGQDGGKHSSFGANIFAQAFTTGGNAAGYTLTGVDIRYLGTASGQADSAVQIRSVGNDGNPSDVLGSLTNPAFTTALGDRVLTHAASGDGIDLAANTTYFIVVPRPPAVTGSTSVGVAILSSDDEDSAGAAGWSIVDVAKRITETNVNPTWSDFSSSSLQVRVNGTLKATTDGVTLSESDLTLTELHARDAEKTYTVVLNTDPGANVTVTVTSGDTTAVAVDTDSGTAVDQSTLTFTHGNSGNWNAAQTVTLRTPNDGDAAAETVTISHTAAVASDNNNPYHQIDIDDVTATTVDAGHGVVVSKERVAVFQSSDIVEYTITLNSSPGGSVVITPTSSDTTTATVSSALTFTTSNWSSPQTMTVTGAGEGSATISHAVTTATTAYPTGTSIASVDVRVKNPSQIVSFRPASVSGVEGSSVNLTADINTDDLQSDLAYSWAFCRVSGSHGSGDRLSADFPTSADDQACPVAASGPCAGDASRYGLRHVAASFLFGLVFAMAGMAPAHADVLISNIGQASPPEPQTFFEPNPYSFFFFSTNVLDHAQSFTTGSNSSGYRLDSVELELQAFDPDISYTVTVRSDSSGSPSNTIGTLSKPSFTAFSGKKILEFSAPNGGIMLAANTDYFVVVDIGIASNSGTPVPQPLPGWFITTSNNEDSDKATGWSIANKHRLSTTAGTWVDNVITSVLKMRLNGVAVTPPARPLVSNTGQTGDSAVSDDNDIAQAFTTGSNADGYTITSVNVQFRDLNASNVFDSMVGTIRENNNGVPGDVVGRLTDPDYVQTSTARNYRFTTAEGGIDIAAET